MSPLTGVVAKRHVQPGEKVAFDSPLVTIVDLKDMELQAAVPATDVPELIDRQTGRTRHRRLRRPPLLGPRRADQSGDRARHALVPCLRRHPEQRQRIARRDVRDGPHRALREHGGRDAAGNGHTPRSRPDIRVDRRGRQARQAESLSTGARDDAAGRVEIRTALPAGTPVLGAKFDNLKDGAPAVVKAPSTGPIPASAPTSGSTQVAG